MLIATLTRLTRDVGLAEDLAQDALVSALEQWPERGVPERPGAWLMAVAKRRAIDLFRRNKRLAAKHEVLARDLEVQQDMADSDLDAEPEEAIGDDLLRLVFISCHPVLSTEARVALTLRLLGGLKTDEIARAFLAPEPTIAQRIVRAKRTLGDAHIPFELPDASERMERLASVLEVIYLIFNEGYSATSGDDWLRPALCDDALRLGRTLSGLMPEEPDVQGLLALMEIQSSRNRARTGPDGEPVLLLEQDRSLWDQGAIQRGLDALARAEALGGLNRPYTLQAAIAACHARARTADATDWALIVILYDALLEVTPSPVIELNRAVAVSMASGPEEGLEAVDALAGEPVLSSYHLLHGLRGDLLFRLGRLREAKREFERAASMTRNRREREQMLKRARECDSP
jgi:RNA polymerase sigma factor (sigma-70 family)